MPARTELRAEVGESRIEPPLRDEEITSRGRQRRSSASLRSNQSTSGDPSRHSRSSNSMRASALICSPPSGLHRQPIASTAPPEHAPVLDLSTYNEQSTTQLDGRNNPAFLRVGSQRVRFRRRRRCPRLAFSDLRGEARDLLFRDSRLQRFDHRGWAAQRCDWGTFVLRWPLREWQRI
jgi:hypothetical protein